MTEKKSLLDALNVKDTLENPTSPFAKNEPTKSIRVVESKYNLIKLLSFEQDKTKSEVVENILDAGIKRLKLQDKMKQANNK